MGKFGSGKLRKRLVVSCFAAAIAAGIVYFLYFYRGEPAKFSVEDIDSSKNAGHIEYLRGAAQWSDSGTAPFSPIANGQSVTLRSVFRVPSGGFVQVATHGNFIVGMDGDGEFKFEDARLEPSRNAHSSSWYVKKGMFRAKPHDYDPSAHLLEVRTEAARIVADQAELGMKIIDGGTGQIWLRSGEATIYWKDGRTKPLKPHGMDYL